MEKLVLLPGPVMVHEDVLLRSAKQVMNHRSEEFEEILAECVELSKYLFRTDGDVAIITGSGTAAMEAAIYSLVEPGEEVVAVVNGKFGERFADIAERRGAEVRRVEFEWGEAADPERVEEVLADSDAEVVTLVHNETSTTVLNPAEEIARICREYDALFVVDAISSLGGVEFRMDDWGVDVCITGSQKVLGCPPGLALVAVNDRALEVMEEKDAGSYYLDIPKYLEYLEKDPKQTPYTPAVNTFYALHEALRRLKEEGLEARWKRYRLMQRVVREGIRALGLELFVEDDGIASPTVTGVVYPEGVDDRVFRGKILRDRYDVVVAGGQDHLAGKIFRIGHMGEVRIRDMITAVTCIGLGMRELGVDVDVGAAAETMAEVLSEVS
ncbi:pyridoxal-phosphate-dependent aminotransferase family protein [Methanopyrus sp.]